MAAIEAQDQMVLSQNGYGKIQNKERKQNADSSPAFCKQFAGNFGTYLELSRKYYKTKSESKCRQFASKMQTVRQQTWDADSSPA
eukprot:4053899-Amphidinium_carterae.1